jgi:hypothetical protein
MIGTGLTLFGEMRAAAESARDPPLNWFLLRI